MDGQTDGRTDDGRTDGRTYGRSGGWTTDGLTDGRMDERTDGRKEGWTNGCTNERKDELTEGWTYTTRTQKGRVITVRNGAGFEICNASLDRLYETALVLEYVRPLWTFYNSEYTVELVHVDL